MPGLLHLEKGRFLWIRKYSILVFEIRKCKGEFAELLWIFEFYIISTIHGESKIFFLRVYFKNAVTGYNFTGNKIVLPGLTKTYKTEKYQKYYKSRFFHYAVILNYINSRFRGKSVVVLSCIHIFNEGPVPDLPASPLGLPDRYSGVL